MVIKGEKGKRPEVGKFLSGKESKKKLEVLFVGWQPRERKESKGSFFWDYREFVDRKRKKTIGFLC